VGPKQGGKGPTSNTGGEDKGSRACPPIYLSTALRLATTECGHNFRRCRFKLREIASCERFDRECRPQPQHVDRAKNATAVAKRDCNGQQPVRMRRSAVIAAGVSWIPRAIAATASLREDRIQPVGFARKTVLRF